MKRKIIRNCVVALLVLTAFTLVAADFSPFTSTPSETDVPKDGECRKGRFECRWGGSCVKRGSKCYSCIDGYQWSDELGSCYKCGEGQSLVNVNGEWRCQG
ncbi:MAG TPA: hypothetical protein VF111_14885 [Thermoanaerobaculia bacterium]